jgi:hypothetical protein
LAPAAHSWVAGVCFWEGELVFPPFFSLSGFRGCFRQCVRAQAEKMWNLRVASFQIFKRMQTRDAALPLAFCCLRVRGRDCLQVFEFKEMIYDDDH